MQEIVTSTWGSDTCILLPSNALCNDRQSVQPIESAKSVTARLPIKRSWNLNADAIDKSLISDFASRHERLLHGLGCLALT